MSKRALHRLFSAELDGDFAILLIGMRVHRPWKLHKILWVQRAMAGMMRELGERRELGMLHAESFFGLSNFMLVQYWRSFEHLERYANDPALGHVPVWRAFLKKVGADGDIGIWHETYAVDNQRYESIYGAMPLFGLARAGRRVDVKHANRKASQRLKQRPSMPAAAE